MDKQRFFAQYLGVSYDAEGKNKLYTVFSYGRAIGHTPTEITADYHPNHDPHFKPCANWQNTFSPRLIAELGLSTK